MFSAVAGMASMFGLKRKEETQTEVLKDIYSDLQQIKTSFQITIVPASEEREKEFDKEKRHQELLAAFRRAGLAMSRGALVKDGDKDKKGNWLTRLATTYFSYKVLKGFLKRFFKIMKLGRLWPLLRGAGLLLSRLFWPLAIAAVLIWAIPKIIDNWPAIVQTAKDAMNAIWDTMKEWLSYLGIDFDDDEMTDTGEDVLREGEIAPNYTPMWDAMREVWVVNNIPLPWIPEERKDIAITAGQMMRAGNSLPDIQEALSSYGILPQQDILGKSVAQISGFDNDFVSMVKEAEGFRGEAYQDEGGKWTVGYGHTGDDVIQGTTMSESAATTQLGTDLGEARTKAQVQVDKDFGPGTFADLSTNKQNLLTDVAFNTGSVSSMPKLTSAVVGGDKTGIATEYKRYMTTSTGERKELVTRNSLVQRNLIAPILSESTPSGSSSVSFTSSSSNVSSASSTTPSVSSTSSTTPPPIFTTPSGVIPGELEDEVIVINSSDEVIDNSFSQTAANFSSWTNKDRSPSTPHWGLYA